MGQFSNFNTKSGRSICKGKLPRPDSRSHKKKKRPSEEQFQLMAERVEQGLDIFTGQPLQGYDAESSAQFRNGQTEQPPQLSPRELKELQESFDWFDLVESVFK